MREIVSTVQYSTSKTVYPCNFVVLHDCSQKTTRVFCTSSLGWLATATINVAGPTTPLADQRSPASPGSVSMGLGTWPVTVALPEIIGNQSS